MDDLPPHGTRSRYDLGCRCPACREARHLQYMKYTYGQARPHYNPEKRVCAHPGCNTILSGYNEDAYCALHLPLYIHYSEVYKRRAA